MPQNLDLSVYFIADPSLCAGRDVVDVVMMAARGGATLIQYRNKHDPMNDVLAEAAMLQEWLAPMGIPLLINDYVDVAQAVGAAGVHLGQGDASPEEAREKLGADAIIGQTAFTPEHMAALQTYGAFRADAGKEAAIRSFADAQDDRGEGTQDGRGGSAQDDDYIVDYVGTGPFYETKTDKGKPVLGADKFAELVKLSPVPVVGIGGITPENARAVMMSGAAGVAMMRSVSEAERPEDAVRAFKSLF